MKRAVRWGVWIAVLAAAGMLGSAYGQQSTGGTANSKQGHTQASKYKQDFGPQTMPRRGDRMTADKPSGKGGAHGGTSSTVRRRKRQERRKDGAKQ